MMMEGWLTKRRDHMNIIWLERYFTLDGNQLRYYRKRGDPTPRGTYVITKDCVVGKVFNSEEKHRHHDAVWMFRITFSVDADVKKSYKKDRFLDLGAQSEIKAKEWKAAIEKAIVNIREIAEQHQDLRGTSDIGATPAGVNKLFQMDEDSIPLFNLDADTNKSESGWWLARVEAGLRIMQESPLGHNAAASMLTHHANTTNVLVYSLLLVILILFIILNSMVYHTFIMAIIGFGTIGIYCYMTFPKYSSSNIPSLRVSQVVRGSPTEVFRLIMNSNRVHRWDCSISSCKLIQEMDDHAAILYVTQRPVFFWPLCLMPRDLVLMRYWRREEDGSYFVMYQSITHPECRKRSNYIRANLIGGGFVIAPQKGTTSGDVKSLVTYVMRYDPKGYSSIFQRIGMGINLVMPMLQSIIGIRDEMATTDFITPIVTGTETISPASPSSVSMDTSLNGTSKITNSVESITNGSSTKYLKTNLPKKMWSEPEASKFIVRGPKYFTDKKKIPSGPAGFHVVGVDLFSFERSQDRYGIGNRPDSPIQGSTEFTFIFNFIIPGPANLCLTIYFQPARPKLFEDGSPFSELLNDFIDGDDEFRNGRFKLIPTVVEGSFLIKQSVGSKPALLGNKLNCPYIKGKNFFEVDIDISSNSVANTVVGMLIGVTKSLVVDVGFLFESQSEEELPETILGAVRLSQVSLDNPIRMPALS